MPNFCESDAALGRGPLLMRFKNGKPYRFIRPNGDTVELAPFTKWEDGSAGIRWEASEASFSAGKEDGHAFTS